MINMASRDYNVRSYLHFKTLFIAGGGSSGSTSDFRFDNHDFFTFSRAEDVFKNFFGGKDPFADFMDNDDFMDFGSFG